MNRKRALIIIWIWVALSCIYAIRHGSALIGSKPPFATDGNSLMILIDKDPNWTIPPEQSTIVYGTSGGSVIDWANKNCAKAASGAPQWIVVNKGDDMKMADKWIQEAYESIKELDPPAIVFSNGKSGFGPEPLAKNTEEELKRLAPFGAKR